MTRLGLDGANYDEFATAIRETSVFAQSDPLPFATYPIDELIAGDTLPVAVNADGLLPGRPLLVRGVRQRDGAAIVHATALVAAHRVDDGRSRLEIDPPLSDALIRSSVVVHGNVALGDARRDGRADSRRGRRATPFQRFELKQLPLTYVQPLPNSAPASELTVRVDDIDWHERDTLFGAAPRDRAYTVTTDEQGRRGSSSATAGTARGCRAA